ncbi:hypothetical protein FQZ97_1031100 [compost metagenome]
MAFHRSEQAAEGKVDQPLGRIAEHFVQGTVGAGDLVVQTGLHIAVADGVENDLATVLALRQAFEHPVEFASQAAELVVSMDGQSR